MSAFVYSVTQHLTVRLTSQVMSGIREHCLFEMGRDYLGRCRSKGCGEKESLGSEVEKA